jgi:uncharacterized protein YbjT (DUF2867 family)
VTGETLQGAHDILVQCGAAPLGGRGGAMKSPVLVTGGTGRLGRHVVRRLRDAQCEVRVLTRRSRESADGVEFVRGDLATGEGVATAVDGAAAIVHCATSSKGDVGATQNLVRAAATQNLVRAASRAGAPHLVYVSIVGIDHISSWGYPKAKLQAERIVAESGLPWTILRVTQFYDYILTGLQKLARLPVVPVPAGFDVQPIDPDEVAARLVELTLGEPAGRVPDLAGPQVSSWAGLLRGYLRASHRRRWVVPVRIPGTRAVRAGGLLPAPGHAVGHRTWEQFLAASLQATAPEATQTG